jgi:DNA repair protein RecO
MCCVVYLSQIIYPPKINLLIPRAVLGTIMSQEISLRGFILKTQALGEADLLLTFFSEEQGKIRLLAKSAKKLTSRLAGRLQPTNCLELTLAGNGSLPKLIGVQTLASSAEILNKQDALAALMTMQELVNRALPDSQPNPELFHTFGTALEQLADKVESTALVLARFFTKALQSVGLAPRVLAETQAKQVYFSQIEGRFAGQPSSSDDLPIEGGLYELYISLFNDQPISRTEATAAIPLLKFLNSFAAYQLERPLYAAQYFWQSP